MKNLVQFIKEEIRNQDSITAPGIYTPLNCFRLHLKEEQENAAVKTFYLYFSKEEKDVIAVHFPEKQKIQRFLTKHAFICDYLVLFPSKKRILLVELKGKKVPDAKKQIKHGYCFLEYIISLCNMFAKRTISLDRVHIAQLIVTGTRNRTLETNALNRSGLTKDQGFIICERPDEGSLHVDLIFKE